MSKMNHVRSQLTPARGVAHRLARSIRNRAGMWSVHIPLVGTIGLAVVLVFLPTIQYAFSGFDEVYQIVQNPLLEKMGWNAIRNAFSFYCISSYYPVRFMSFVVDYSLWGHDAKGYHVTNVTLHAINGVLLYFLIYRVLKKPAEYRIGAELSLEENATPATTTASLFGALFFVVHPVVVEAAAWIGAREELLMTMFLLASVHCWIAAQSERHGGRQFRALLLSLGSAYLGLMSCLSNVVGVVLPLLCCTYSVIYLKERRIKELYVSTWYLWLFSINAVVIKWAGNLYLDTLMGGKARFVTRVTLWEKPLVIMSVFWNNVKSIVHPTRLALIYENAVPESYANGDVIGGLLLVLILVVLIGWRLRKSEQAMMGIMWFLIALAPSANIRSQHIFRCDRFLYLSVIGVSILCSWLYLRIYRSRWRHVIVVVMCSVLFLLTGKTRKQMRVWRNPITVFQRCIEVHPKSFKACYNLGGALIARGNFSQGIELVRKSLDIKPRDYFGLRLLSQACLVVGDTKTAMDACEQLLEISPTEPEVYFLYADALSRETQFEDAMQKLDSALQYDPNNTNIDRMKQVIRNRRKEYEFEILHRDERINRFGQIQ